MMLSVILLIIWFIVIAMLWGEGAWSNALALFNVFFAGVVATNYFEPVAGMLEGSMKSFTYALDYLAFWLIFALAFNVCRAATDQISKHKVRFRKPVEHTGRILFAVLTGWLVVCIFTATLHFAPLRQTCFQGGFGKGPLAPTFFGFSPDKYWLAFFHSRSAPSGGAMTSGEQFDPSGDYVLKYGSRRYNLQKHNESTDGSIRVK